MHLLQKLFIAASTWAIILPAWAQTEDDTHTIFWRAVSPSVSAPEKTATLLPFDEAFYNNGEEVPYYMLSLPGVAVSFFEFTHVEFAPLTEAEMASFPKNRLKTEIQPSVTIGTANRVPNTVISFQPFRLHPQTGKAEKLLRFSYKYKTESAARKKSEKTSHLRTYAAASVLSTGAWYKIGVTSSGIFKIDRAALQAMGINVQGLNPKKIKLYGNGGGMLPQPNNTPRPDDLLENAIWVAGEQDGSFDANDYILFYGQSPHTWITTPAAPSPFALSYNLYSDTTYYYLSVGSVDGLRVGQQASLAGNYPVITSYEERWHHEKDIRNVLQSGREWYGEEFSSFIQQPAFTIQAPDLVPNSTVKFTSAVMGDSPASNSFTIRLNGAVIGEHAIAGRGTFAYHPAGVNSVKTFSPPLNSLAYSNSFSVAYTYDPKGSSQATGYLNYFTLVAERQLKLIGDQISFRSLRSQQNIISTYQVAGVAPDAQVWNITDPIRPFRQECSLNNGLANFSASSQQLQEYLVFQGSNFPTPTYIGRVNNQNLHSLNANGSLDLVIITPPAFLAQAQRLATYRRTQSGLEVEVVLLPQIFEEFSSGKQDVTAIRDFMKMLYERSNKQGQDRINLLLLGDASFDPKRRVLPNTNFIPIYESRESLEPVFTYSSDDFFGFLDDIEGEWSETNFSLDHRLDIGIGRLPAKSGAEADIFIDKIIRYESDQTFGNWRKRLVFLADDGDGNEHLNDAENLAEYIERTHPDYLPQKLYLDLYPQASVPNGQRSPELNKALRDAIEKGALVVNYTGHGNEVSLADEQVITLNDIQNWKNTNRLTFLLTATCEFGRYDDPKRNSGAELALLSPTGGAIGLLTTTRPVFSDGNRKLNTEFFRLLFKPLLSGKMPDLGYLMSETKNNSLSNVNNRNFALLGDPSMRLAYPQLEVALTHINGKPFSSFAAADTLKALAKATFTGEVRNQDQVDATFQGQVHVTVYDKRTSITTLGDVDAKRQVLSRNNVLYDGLATVQNGTFEVSLVVPKDINYVVGEGSIQLYAFSSDKDGHGGAPVLVGQADPSAVADTTPPSIRLFMNDDSFVSGGITAANTILLAHLSDKNGINTAGAGIGHDITAVLDYQTSSPLILNEFYSADIDSYQSGKVRYALKDLSEGSHTLQFKAWDTHNNSNTAQIDFIVSSSEKLALTHVLNAPNPFIDKTTFHFDHNRPDDNLDILINIFTVSGRLVKTLKSTSKGKTHFSDLDWDGRDDSSSLLAKGVYIYQVNVRSRQDGANVSKSVRLVLLK